ncbi:hypothetical protein KQI30_00175 [Clostridium bornimense]|uniref:DUF6398 domain-containing protein n=1 Tax=Clostridium bornimense TaxID=1216932 RepID=UPI001C114A61|nr:DUF6398 domain-containing protein [Clostridium bornimense]MBU5314698.1 hypothetical protein [Clostridium bornimense]
MNKVMDDNLLKRYEDVKGLIEEYCNANLSEEFAGLCIRAIDKVIEINEKGFSKGRLEGWACGAVHALAGVNFYFEKFSKINVKASDLYKSFNISSSTALSRSKEIRDGVIGADIKDWVTEENKSTLKEIAYNIAREAIYIENYEERINEAYFALSLYDKCVDAMLIIADEEIMDLNKKKEAYKLALDAGYDEIKEDFENLRGNFWTAKETQPYMLAKFSYGDLLWALGEKEEAIKEYTEMIELNNSDSQGIRYILINWLLETNKDEEAEKLLATYDDDTTAIFMYARALLSYKYGEVDKAKDQLKEAVKANSFIPPYLLGYKSMPKSLPDFCTPGDEKEAIMYCWYSLSTWRSILGSLQWLRKNYR